MRVLIALLSCLLAFAPAATTQTLAAQREVPWQALAMGLARLDQSLVQQLDGELWSDVRDSVRLGLAAIDRARRQGSAPDVCQATRATLQAVITRQELLEREAFAEDAAATAEPDDESARATWLDQEYNAVYDGYGALADDLLYQEGQLPQTSWLLVELLFTVQRDVLAGDVLARALARWPRQATLHEQAKAWAEVLRDPASLAAQLQSRVDLLDVADADFAGLALETIGQLQQAVGKSAYARRDYAAAGEAFDLAARSLQRAQSMPRQWGPDEIAYRRADNMVNAAYSFLGLALERWAEERTDEQGTLAAEACEEQITKALAAVPGHPAASQAVLWLGDQLLNKGEPAEVTVADQAQARDFYGRMARRFADPDWWNNYAFWCRETGTAAAQQGDTKQARELYEQSYDAYVKTIELAPDNARYVNDTGLMLFYHLDRDLDQAESLFKRSWELGQDVCANPFVEEAVFEQNFSAYTDAILNLARLYLQRGDLELAQQTVDTLIELAPERLDAQRTRRAIDLARGGQG